MKKNHMIKPVNGHLLIEPLALDSFVASQRDSYQEIGTVVAISSTYQTRIAEEVHVGDKVFFDAWLAKKYAKEGTTNEFYWLVKWDDVTAVEYAKQESVSELNLSE